MTVSYMLPKECIGLLKAAVTVDVEFEVTYYSGFMMTATYSEYD